MNYDQVYRDTIKYYQQHGDIEIVAKIMNESGVSYKEVLSIVNKYKNSQRKGFLLGGLAAICGGGIIVGINMLMAVGIGGIFPILTAMGIGLIILGLWCLYRCLFPK